MSWFDDVPGASAIAGTLGLGGTSNAQTQAQMYNPLQATTVAQTGQSYDQANAGLNSQQNFLNALAGQNGIQNQSSVFNQQQALANQMQGVANGTGPNPALAQLNQTTGQNIAAQTAMWAGQRGSGANAGLIARQAAMQGANTQQQAVGQGATLAAQQQIAGMSALAAQQQALGNTAGTQVSNQQSGLQQYNQAAQSEQSNLLGSLANYNNANVSMQSNVNNNNMAMAMANAGRQAQTAGSLINGASAALPLIGLAHGGMVQHFDNGGQVAPSSMAGQFLFGGGAQPSTQIDIGQAPQQQAADSSQDPFSNLAGGITNLMATPASVMAPASAASGAGAGAAAGAAMAPMGGFGGAAAGIMSAAPMAALALAGGGAVNGTQGMQVGGQAKVKGDSYSNDTVPAMLSPGEVVIPRHVMQSKDPVHNAAKFVAAILSKQHLNKKVSK